MALLYSLYIQYIIRISIGNIQNIMNAEKTEKDISVLKSSVYKLTFLGRNIQRPSHAGK